MNTKHWPQPWRKRAKRSQRKATKAICTSRGKQSVMANGDPRALNRLRIASDAFQKAKLAAARCADEERKREHALCQQALIRAGLAK